MKKYIFGIIILLLITSCSTLFEGFIESVNKDFDEYANNNY